MTLNQLSQLQVSVDRIQHFLCRPEVDGREQQSSLDGLAVRVHQSVFDWEQPDKSTFLKQSQYSSTPEEVAITVADARSHDAVETNVGVGVSISTAKAGSGTGGGLELQPNDPKNDNTNEGIESAEAAGTKGKGGTGSEGGKGGKGQEKEANSETQGGKGKGSDNQDAAPGKGGKDKSSGAKGLGKGTDKKGAKLRLTPMEIPTGEFVCIVGQVGAGKSSFLSALLGDMRAAEGSLESTGSVAYCSQQPWVVNATLRDNVTFGLEFDRKRFERAVFACALEDDLDVLPGGEMCEIGERGITLSGGQKARVSLARAIYAESDIYLLDDVLSAVDAHVGQHIYEHCLMGCLANKTRIVVTNQLQFLNPAGSFGCDRIVLLDHCKMVQVGTFDVLMKSNASFALMIQSHLVEEIDAPRSKKKRVISAKKDEVDIQDQAKAGKLTSVEVREEGAVGLTNYKRYAKAAGHCLVVSALICFTCTEVCRAVAEFSVADWSKENRTESEENEFITRYASFIAASVVFLLIRGLLLAEVSSNASKGIHSQLLNIVMHAKMTFFDTTQTGQIMNRFSRDMDFIDLQVRQALFITLSAVFQLALAICTISVATNGYAIIVIIPLVCIYQWVNTYFRATSTELQRLESISRSPIFSLFSETLAGFATIRGYDASNRFGKHVETLIDINSLSLMTWRSATSWLTMRLELVAATISCSIVVFAIYSDGAIEASKVGLALAYSLEMTSFLKMTTQMSAELESKMTSVERVYSYIDTIEQEPPALIDDERQAPAEWPAQGAIEFKDAVMKYREGTDPVLRGVTFKVPGGSRVGIVGRTGAGKSSVLVALFRLQELCEGSILVDGVEIRGLGLLELRSALTIIPQDPVVFTGTLRYNLDPFGLVPDDETLWKTLEVVEMKQAVEALEGGLDFQVSESGSNFSVGQRALLCMCRALLRKPRILAMDEATAAVDYETDKLIQTAIRERLAGSTVLTIAHRINTIMDYDQVLMLDKGSVLEYAPPLELLNDEESAFRSLAEDSGINIAQAIVDLTPANQPKITIVENAPTEQL